MVSPVSTLPWGRPAESGGSRKHRESAVWPGVASTPMSSPAATTVSPSRSGSAPMQKAASAARTGAPVAAASAAAPSV